MGDTGFVRFPGSLDPRAQEFRPTNPYYQNPNPFALLQPQIYYPYTYTNSGVRYPQLPAPPAYVIPAAAEPPLPPPLPPPSNSPSRTLLLSLVPAGVSESTVRRELEVFGDVRAVQMERVRNGIVTVHFYDLRHAQAALVAIQEQHMQQQRRLKKHFDAVSTHNSLSPPVNFAAPLPLPARGLIAGRAVWAQFCIPVAACIPEGHNQGTLVIFNLESDFSASTLKEIFEAFGVVKELRETPLKKHQKFVEFYDTRDASKALSEMNGKEIQGKHLVIQFSRPGGHFNNNNFSSQPISPPNHSTTTLGPSMGSPNGNGAKKITKSGIVLQASMASLSLSGGGDRGGGGGRIVPKKNGRKSSQSSTTITSNKGSRGWKGSRHSKEYDPRFLINEDGIVESNCRDSRTTVMIKNIPNKYSQKLLLNMLDNHCIHCNEQIADDGDDQPLSSYDFVYLPIDFINKCNVGYGFVNMTSPQATLRLYKAFHSQNWEVFNSRKICEVTYARLQGVEALKEHFKNSRFPCAAEEYLPVAFAPPRDGRRLTEPIPIVGRAINARTKESSEVDVMSGENDIDVVSGARVAPNGGDSGGHDHIDDEAEK